MKTKYSSAIIASLVSTFIFAGVTYAASIDAKNALGGDDGDFFDFTDTTLEVGSLKVGEQGVGGVTFFNGSVINSTVDTYGNDLPVTISDNLRVDGAIQRGTNQSGDQWGVKIDDGLRVYGDAYFERDLNSLGSSHISGNFRVDGQIQRGHNLPSDQWGVEINDDLSVFGDIDFNAVTSVLNIPGQEFNPVDTSIGAVYSTSAIASSTTGSIFSAPIQLPDGATITKAEITVFDLDAAEEITLSLKKNIYTAGDNPIDLGKQIDMSTIATAGSGGSVQVINDTSISEATIDNSAAYYTALLSMPADVTTMQFMNLRITYTFTELY